MHLGLICPDISGHLNPMTTLGRALQCRGHRVTLLTPLDGRPKAEAAGLEFVPYAEKELPLGHRAEANHRLGELSGRTALRHTLERLALYARLLTQYGPELLRTHQIDGLLVDQVSPAGGTVADRVGIPFVTICNAIALHSEPDVPSPLLPFAYRPTLLGRLRNEAARQVLLRLTKPLADQHSQQRSAWGLPPIEHLGTYNSPLAQITQQPACFDFPRRALPPVFHYTGPFLDHRSQDEVAFPWERLDGRPLIYASMGTLQNRLHHVFHTMAAACAGLGAQVVISLGDRSQPVPTDLPGDPIVVPFAPQVKLLERAALVLTHAGMNTVLETLSYGLPMVAIPVANDQPGIAARLVYLGAGETVSLAGLGMERLRKAVRRVWEEPRYRERAQCLQREIAAVNGAARAAEIAEKALQTGKPVLRDTLE